MNERNGHGKFAGTNTAEREARVLQYARDGMSARKIAPLVGYAHGHVCRILRRYGLQRPRGKTVREVKETTTTSAFPGSEYNDEERRYLIACDQYRRKYGKRYLSGTDYLKILKGMGYSRG